MQKFRYSMKNDYDHKVQIGGENIFCYSAKKMKGISADVLSSAYEARAMRASSEDEGEAKKGKDLLGELHFGKLTLGVSAAGTHAGLLYKRVGYVALEDGGYLALCVSRVPFLIVLLALLAALVVAIVLLLGRVGQNEPPVIKPDHPLPPIDTGLVPEDEDGTAVESPEGGGSVSMIYTLTADLSLTDRTVDIYFRNPAASNHGVALEFYIVSDGVEYFVAQSGLIPPGNGLFSLTLDDLAPQLSEGLYEGLYRLYYYDPLTGVRAHVGSDIAGVQVTVTD